MFITSIIIAIGALAVAATLYIAYLSETTLRDKLRNELPESTYAQVKSISNEYGKEYGTTYHLSVQQRNGSTKNVDVKCKSGSISRYSRIAIY